ncbi:MAG: SET domain-containing protein-lysine N-methyltransferase [Parachlamydiales bacterium]
MTFYDAEAERYAGALWRKRGRDPEREWLGAFHGPDLQAGRVAPLTVRYIDERLGHGVFSEAPLAKGDYVGVYTGILIRRDLLRKRVNDYCFRYPVEAYSLRPLMIDAGQQGNEMRFVNHSDRPNCETIGVPYRGLVYLLVRAAAPIAKGEQLTIDYGPAYWRHRKRRAKLSNIVT